MSASLVYRSLSVLILPLILSGGLACSEKKGASNSSPQNEAACRDWAAAMEKALATHDKAAFVQLFDTDSMMRRAAREVGLDETALPMMTSKEEVQLGLDDVGIIWQAVKIGIGEGGYCHLLHLCDESGTIQPLFRYVDRNGEITYRRFKLAQLGGGKIMATDAFQFYTGNWISDELRDDYRTVMVAKKIAAKELGEREQHLQAGDSFLSAARNALSRVNDQLQMLSGAVAVFNELPADQKKRRSVWLKRVELAKQISEADYRQTADEYRKAFVSTPELDLRMYTEPFTRVENGRRVSDQKEREEALERLDRAIGGDPFLDLFRASFELERGNAGRALELAQRVTVACPDMPFGYDAQIFVRTAEKEFKEVADLYDQKLDRLSMRRIWNTKRKSPKDAFLNWPGFDAWYEKYQSRSPKSPGK